MLYPWWREEEKDNSIQASYDCGVLKDHKLKPCHGWKKFAKDKGKRKREGGVRVERRESFFPNSNPRERKTSGEWIILGPKPINIPCVRNYKYAPTSGVLNMTLRLYPY
jgi:hypothetical protein